MKKTQCRVLLNGTPAEKPVREDAGTGTEMQGTEILGNEMKLHHVLPGMSKGTCRNLLPQKHNAEICYRKNF